MKNVTVVRTWHEWKAEGFHVIKGQKAHSFNDDGVATFTDSQVEKNQSISISRTRSYKPYRQFRDMWISSCGYVYPMRTNEDPDLTYQRALLKKEIDYVNKHLEDAQISKEMEMIDGKEPDAGW